MQDNEDTVKFSCQVWLSDKRLPDGVPHPSLEFSTYWSIGDIDPRTKGKRIESYANIELGSPSETKERIKVLEAFLKLKILNQETRSRIILNVSLPSTVYSYLLPKDIVEIAQALGVEVNIRLR